MNRFEILNQNNDFGVTIVENSFINHYMQKARGDFVKVYLYGLKCCQHSNESTPSFEEIGKSLDIDLKVVEDAFKYWEEQKIVKISKSANTNIIQYINICSMFALPNQVKEIKKEVDEKKEAKLFNMNKQLEEKLGRPLTSMDISIFYSWIDDYNFGTQTVICLIEDCLKRDKRNRKYWEAIAFDWSTKGISAYDEALSYIKERDTRYTNYSKIMDYLGFKRNPSQAEKELMDKWIDEYNLSMKEIKKACGETIAIDKPNFKYVDKVIENWQNKEIKEVSKKPVIKANKKTKLENEANYNEESLEKALFGE